jgi:integrase
MGSIRKRNGKFQAQVRRAGASPISKTFILKKDAAVWVRGIEARIDVGDTAIDAPRSLTLGQLLKRYSEEITPTKKGAGPELRRLRRLINDPISQTPLNAVSSHALATFRDRRILDGVRACQIDLRIISHCWNIAKKEWGAALPPNPVSNIRVPNGIKHRERRLKDGEFEQLRNAARSCRNIYIWPMIQFAIHTAMRRSEILAIRWDDVDQLSRLVKLWYTKNGSNRLVPLSKPAMEVIGNLPKNSSQLFATSDYAIRHSWDRLVLRAGIVNLKFHDLRHEAISRLFEMGLNTSEVSLISGHSDPRMLSRYTHPKLLTTLDKIDAAVLDCLTTAPE